MQEVMQGVVGEFIVRILASVIGISIGMDIVLIRIPAIKKWLNKRRNRKCKQKK